MSAAGHAWFFLAINALVLPFWGAMLLAPQAAITRRVLVFPWICAPFALLYFALFVSELPVLGELIAHPSFEVVTRLIGSPAGTNLAWLHYLTGDLFIGRWIYWDSQERSVTRAVLSVVYLLGLTFCPLALLLYLAVRGRSPSQTAEVEHG